MFCPCHSVFFVVVQLYRSCISKYFSFSACPCIKSVSPCSMYRTVRTVQTLLGETGTARQAHSFFLSKDTFSLMTEMSGDDASITSTQSSDTSIVRSSDDDLSFAEDLCLASIALSFRAGRLKVQHMNWFLHCKSCFFT